MTDSLRPENLRPDPVITGYAVQYGSGGPFLADQYAPIASVENRSYKAPTYKADQTSDEVESRVPPDGKPNEIRRSKPTYSEALAHRFALDDSMTDETALGGLGKLTRGENRTRVLTTKLRLGIEKRCAALLHAAANTLTPGVRWDASSAVVIEKNFDDGKIQFEKSCGYMPTHVVLPTAVKNLVKRDPTIRDLMKYQIGPSFVSGVEELPPTIFGLIPIYPRAMYNTTPALATGAVTLDYLYNQKEAWFLYVDPGYANSQDAMTSMGQDRWGQWGAPFAGYTWPDPHRSAKKTWYSVEVYQNERVVCADAILRILAVA